MDELSRKPGYASRLRARDQADLRQPLALLVCSQGAGVSGGLHNDFTFTISCAKIPPTTAHTGAISEKQYLEDREVKHSTRARGRGCQSGAVLDKSSSQR